MVITESQTAESARPEHRSSKWKSRSVRMWPYLVVVIVALSASALHVARYTVMSPFDESRHLDYMARIYEHGYIVKLGDKLDDTSMRIEACRGVDVPGYTSPPCNTKHFNPADFRDEGYNNAVNHPPGYYVITGAVAEAAKALGLSKNILDPARLMSGVWLALGLCLALYAGELMGIGPVPLVSAAVIYALAPEPLFMAATVNADSSSIFAGGLVLVGALLWERKRLRTGWLLAIGGFVAALKMTNFIGVVIVGLFLLTQAYRVRDRVPVATDGNVADDDTRDLDRADDDELHGRSSREYVIAAAFLAAGALAITLLWMGISSARATVDALALPSNQQFYERGFPWQAFALRQNVFSLFPPLGGLRAPVLVTKMVDTTSAAAGYLAVAALVAAGLRFSARDRLAALGGWAGLVLIVSGPGFILSTWVVNRVIFQPAARYGLSSIAVIIVVTAAMVKGKVATVALALVAALVVLTVLITLAIG